MKLVHLCSIIFFTLNIITKVSGSGSGAERKRKSTTSNETGLLRDQRQRISLKAPLILFAPIETMYEHALTRVAARNPTESGVDISIHLNHVIVDAVPVFVREMMRKLWMRNCYCLVQDRFVDLSPNALPAEIKLFGFIVALALKHSVPLGINLSPMLLQAMTGDLNATDLMEILRDIDQQSYWTLQNLKQLSAEELEQAQLSFDDFGLPHEPVKVENVNRYIDLKVKMILYHSRERALTSFIQGVKLVTPIPTINEVYTASQIANIICPP